MTDVHLSGLGNGNILVYNSSTGIWNNQPQPAVSTTLSALTDCVILNPLNNKGLIYDLISTKWLNKQIDHTTLSSIEGKNTVKLIHF